MHGSPGGADSWRATPSPGTAALAGHDTDALLRMATRLARFGAWAIDVATGAIIWSEEVRALHEVDATFTPTFENAIRFYAPEFLPVIQEAVERCVTTGEPYDLELKLITARGNHLWVRTIGEGRRDARGTIVRIEGAFQDITPQKRAWEEYQRLAERLTATLESTSDAFFALDRDWRFTYLNGQAERIIGAPRGDYLGRVIWDQFPADHTSIFRQHFERALAQNTPERFEAYYPPFNAWFEAHAYPSEHGLSVYFRDISARKHAAERLAENAALLNHASDAIMVRSTDGVIRFWNRAAERIYGWSETEAIGRVESELLGGRPEQVGPATQQMLECGEWTGELNQTTKAGAAVTVQARWTLVRKPDGSSSVLVINSDITSHKAIEQQLLRAQRLDGIGTLAAGIAHDMNNILAPIMMGAALLRSNVPALESEKLIRTIELSAQRGAALVRKLLIFGRGIEGERRPVDVGLAISDVAAIARQTFPKHIKVTTSVAPNLPAVTADPIQVEQVLLNLAVNARDAMTMPGELTLKAEQIEIDAADAAFQAEAAPGSYLLLRVGDTGAGIPPELRQRIFDPFFTTKPPGEGTGLGLSCVLGIVKNHRGFIRVHSELGRGTEFSVYLPAAGAVPAGASPGASGVTAARGNGEIVLLVDDEEPVRAVLRQTLLRSNYSVVSAENGVEAIAVFAATPGVKLVVADLDMPMMDGVTLARVLHRMNPAVRVLVCTGSAYRLDIKDADAGVTDVIRKPFTSAAFAAAVDAVLRRPPAA